MKRPPLTTVLLAGALFLTTGLLAHGQGLTYERWTGVPTSSILMLQRDAVNVRVPNVVQTTALAEIPANAADSYGGRLRGWVTAPETGDYTFFVAGDDNAELWLSPDSSRFKRELIAFTRNGTSARQWNKFASQRSKVIRLVQGESYYLEAWMKENVSSDHLAVGWHRTAVPTFASSNWGSAAGTWTPTAGGYNFSVASGALGGTADAASRTSRTWTGNGEFVVKLEQLAGFSPTAQAGLMLRVDSAANGRHVYIGRNVAGQSVLVSRATVGGTSTTTLGALAGKFLRLVRSGSVITASVSEDGVLWNTAGSVTISSLPSTLEVSVVAAAVTANAATPVTGGFGPLDARPLVATEVIPGINLTPNAADPADTGDKTIPDAWQIANGLVPSEGFGANGPYGDPDKDNIPNWQEYAFGFNPLEPDQLNGVITRELWSSIPGINQVIDLTNHNRFFEAPDSIELTSGIDLYFGTENTVGFGARYRGSITATKTGYYRFWVTAPDDAQLWLADGSIKRPGESQGLTNRFGKRKIASIWGTGYVASRAARYNFEAFACQRSERVWLQQGQRYYFEVLHKTRESVMNHVSVAWQPPGEPRVLIPASAFSHQLPLAADADDDYLPDAWETTAGLSPTLNGRTDRKQGQNGDFDADGLSNLEEYQLGTNPKLADTDGDGVKDRDEVVTYKSNPLVSNLITTTLHTSLNLSQFVTATGAWVPGTSGAMTAVDSRGGVDYAFTVGSGQQGVFEIAITGGAAGVVRASESMPISVTLNGLRIADLTLVSANGGSNTVRALTPWLKPGSYTVTIYHENYRTDRKLRLESVKINKRGGLDLNSDGIPDWAGDKIAKENCLTRVPTTSRTSPAVIEGLASWQLPVVALSSAPLVPLAVAPSPDNGFYASIPLSEQSATGFQVRFSSAPADVQGSIQWSVTNVVELATTTSGQLNLRKGDSLRLDAWGGSSPAGTFTMTLNGIPLNNSQGSATHNSGTPFVCPFNSAGTQTLVATWNGQPHTLTLNVYEANFGAPLSVQSYQTRTWELGQMNKNLIIEADNRIGFAETTASPSAPRRFAVTTYEQAARTVIARLPDEANGAPGAIINHGTVNGFYLAWVDQTNDATLVHTYADGSSLIHATLVVAGMPADIGVRIVIGFQGTQFLDGSKTKNLTAADFDINGVAHIYFEMPLGGDPRICNQLTLFVVNN